MAYFKNNQVFDLFVKNRTPLVLHRLIWCCILSAKKQQQKKNKQQYTHPQKHQFKATLRALHIPLVSIPFTMLFAGMKPSKPITAVGLRCGTPLAVTHWGVPKGRRFEQSRSLSVMWTNCSNRRWVRDYDKTDNSHSAAYQRHCVPSLQVSLFTLGWLLRCLRHVSVCMVSVCPFNLCAETVLSPSVDTTAEMKRLGRYSRLILAIWTRLGVLWQNTGNCCILFNKQEKWYKRVKLLLLLFTCWKGSVNY